MPARFASSPSRVMVLGLDGGTYDVLMPLAQLGLMPNLARLMANIRLSR